MQYPIAYYYVVQYELLRLLLLCDEVVSYRIYTTVRSKHEIVNRLWQGYDRIQGYMNKLRTKQRLFIQEYIKSNGNGTQSALKVYDTIDKPTAGSIATENLKKPEIQQELKTILQRRDLQLDRFTNKLSDIVGSEPLKGYSGADIVEAVKTGLKLHGVLTDRKVTTTYNLNADLEKLSTSDLIERHKKLSKETQSIIEGDNTIEL